MNFKNYIRLKFITRFIRRNFPLHEIERKPVSLENAALIGLIFNGNSDEESLAALDYAHKLSGFKKVVKMMAFIPQKKVEGIHQYPYFYKKDLNWLNRPSCNLVDDFIDIPFDVLINLSIEVLPPLEFIAGASQAKFRIGLYRETKLPHYDFLIHVKENPTVEKLISNIDTYLK